MLLRSLFATAAAALVLSAAPARAVTLGFGCITNNLAGDCAIGEAQLTVEISDQGGGVVRFHFRNAGPAASVLSEVYFDDGSLLAIAAVVDGPGVDFEEDADPPNLPGGQNVIPPFQVTEGFLAQSVPSASMNGAGPSEWVAIDFTLQGAQTFADVLDDLDSGALRIGIHVIAFDSEGSESFVNVPEPAVALLGLCGFIGGLALARPARPLRSGARAR
jgi:hypothetical protein